MKARAPQERKRHVASGATLTSCLIGGGFPSGGCIHMHYQLPVEWWSEMLRARHRAMLW
jgi:hypothetical protein